MAITHGFVPAAQPHWRKKTFWGNVGCVDTDIRLHPSLLFPLVLVFPSVLFCSEIFQDFSHHLGDLEMETLSKMFTRFHVMQE